MTIRNRPINYNGRYTLRRDESGNLIIPTGDDVQVERQVSLPPPLDQVKPEPLPTSPQWKHPPNFANWIGGWLRCLRIAKPDEWLCSKIGEIKNPAKPFHVRGWMAGLTLPAPYRFLQTCRVIALMSGKPLADTITEAAEACYRSTGSGYETSIGFSDDSLIDLS